MAGSSLRTQAMRLLARREYARAELADRLAAKGAARSEIRSVLNELAALGYLSNARYALTLAHQKAGRYGRRRIAGELTARGVASGDIEAALLEAGVDDAAALEALWRRRFGTPPSDEREKARQVRCLQARGFSLSAILKLLRAVGGGRADG